MSDASFANFSIGVLKLESNRLEDRVVDEICALRDTSLTVFVVDCPIEVDGELFGVVCAIPECCTGCTSLVGRANN
jgi:hypothetical protein